MADPAHGGDGGGIPHSPSWVYPLLEPLYGGHEVPPYAEAITISLITAAGLVVASALLTRRLQRVPSRSQAALEIAVTGLDSFVSGIIGHGARRYLPLVGTLFLYIAFMNLSGLIPGWGSPTANVNITAALAVTVFLYVQYEGIRVNGLVGYLKHFAGEPAWLAPLNFPLHIIGELAKPLSLTLRLFGNIFGEDTIILILIGLAPFFLPIQFPMVILAAFTSCVQALVFSVLTAIYLALVTAHHEEHAPDSSHDTHQPHPAGHPA